MHYVMYFLSGLFLANGIPHFIHGISGKEFHSPSLHRTVFRKVPSPLFNALWGLLSFTVAAMLLQPVSSLVVGWNAGMILFVSGFCFASVGLSVYFKNRSDKDNRDTPEKNENCSY